MMTNECLCHAVTIKLGRAEMFLKCVETREWRWVKDRCGSWIHCFYCNMFVFYLMWKYLIFFCICQEWRGVYACVCRRGACVCPCGDEHGCRSQHVSSSNSASVKHLSLLPSPTASSQPTLPRSIHHLSSIIYHQWQLPISSLLNYRLDFLDIQ